MSREVRTLWWTAQGLLILLLCGYFGYIAIGSILWGVHGLMALYSQFIQGVNK